MEEDQVEYNDTPSYSLIRCQGSGYRCRCRSLNLDTMFDHDNDHDCFTHDDS